MSTPTQTPTPKTIYVTRTGLPLSFKLDWPFRHATSGADFDVLHTVITLENSGGLRALVAVNLSVTLREVLPSLEPKDTEAPIINALRKEVDRKQTEFVKSGKLVPLPLSSRHYSFKLKQWVFGKASDEEIARMIERKAYWQTRLVGGDVWLGDSTEALYVDTTTDHIAEIAAGLARQGLFTMARRYANALPALMDQKDRFESEMATARQQLEEKHAFEKG
ncbi:MAG TPA: hypothetical protein VE957_19375 [Terriglobales bacterium]|nr:hypothetical protein [Terriglobales bacterium]